LSLQHGDGRVAIAVRDEMQSAAFAGLGHVTLLHPFRDALESLASELCQHISNPEKPA
jgi:hypothetical protein